MLVQIVMLEVENAGWKKKDGGGGMSDINEEEIRSIFNMIDKDKSGQLSLRVTLSISCVNLSTRSLPNYR